MQQNNIAGFEIYVVLRARSLGIFRFTFFLLKTLKYPVTFTHVYVRECDGNFRTRWKVLVNCYTSLLLNKRKKSTYISVSLRYHPTKGR